MNSDANYVRRVTFNVGRVVEVTATSVILAQPLLAGAPAAGASAQVVAAFVDREGGSFFQEWSALFVAEPESGGRVCFYYPRLSPNPGAGAGRREFEIGRGMEAAEERGRDEDECADERAGERREEFVTEVFAGRFLEIRGTADVGGAACLIHCAAVHGYERWANGVVLSELFSGGDGGGVLRGRAFLGVMLQEARFDLSRVGKN